MRPLASKCVASLTAAVPRRVQPCRPRRLPSASRPVRQFATSHPRCSDSKEPNEVGPKAEPEPKEEQKQTPPKRKSRRAVWAASTALLVAGYYWAASDSAAAAQLPDDGSSIHRSGSSLNTEIFVPFQVVARESVSPTAFVLTLRLPRVATPESRAATRALIDKAWQHGLWSIEIKQPQLQIARDYTPLPDVDVSRSTSTDDVEIRIFVRTVPGGEVSRYLSQRVVGSTIDVRGPRLSFDVASRLASRVKGLSDTKTDHDHDDKKVVILAGGTGIATALQAASSVLSTTPPTSQLPVTILWANRLGQDSVGLDGGDASLANPVVRDLRALQTRYGADRVRILSYVDAQQSFITEGDVHKFVDAARQQHGWMSYLWPFGSSSSSLEQTPPPPPSASAVASAQPCVYHSKKTLERLESDPEYGSARAYCLCKKVSDSNSDRTAAVAPSPPGANLVLVSGPDGFVSAWAGPKTWAAGLERQGPVGGILGKMAAKDAKLAEWQVLKL